MAPATFLQYNGKSYKADKLLISPDNRSFRYGDGFFETIKMVKGKILLEDLHMERLFSSMDRLYFQKPSYFTPDYIKEQILALAKQNYHDKLGRIRLTIFRGNGGLYDPENHFPNYIIQTWALNPANNNLNENGLITDIYPDARKAADQFSSIKSNNYLSYAMAALWAKKEHLNDAILLNANNRIADSTIANIFIVQNGVIKTPPLTEGPVSGNMRRYLLQSLRKENMPVEESPITAEELKQAAELFFTNAIYGIKWVKQLGNSQYSNNVSSMLHKKFIAPLFLK